jgi:hypothetical protein
MYYKESPYGQASYPQEAYYGEQQQQQQPQSEMMYGNVMETIKGYFSNPWVIVVAVILVVIVIAWLMSGKEGYRHY